MMAETTIEWTATRMPDGTLRSGYTFNPWIGCTRVHEGCRHCYAERDWDNRRGVARWGPGGTRVVTSAANWRKPLKWNHDAATTPHPMPVEFCRAKVFCASLADVFEDWQGEMHSSGLDGGVMAVDDARTRLLTMDDCRARLFHLIDHTPHLDWIILTKRPENIRRMWPTSITQRVLPRKNVWLLTSVSDQASADKQIPELMKCWDLSPVLGLSAEPLLGPIDLQRSCTLGCPNNRQCVVDKRTGHRIVQDSSEGGMWVECACSRLGRIGWVIAGGESGHGARPMHPDWARSLRDQCVSAGVPFFFKQWGEYSPELQPDAKWEDVRIDSCGRDVTTLPGLWDESDAVMYKVGKKAAGRILDGRTWDEFPAVKAVHA